MSGLDRENYMDHEVLQLFAQLSQIPRESGKEQDVSDWIKGWAEERGLAVRQDAIWDLVIAKAGSAGYEDHPPVLLQAHIDMVCEKDRDSAHDFSKDPIALQLDGDWLTSADGTTLGADNGIGVAAAMALLADDTLPHPPLEVVFTVQEETSFAGAETVDVSDLKSRRMINLDHADEHELIVGSCGGTGAELTMPLEREPAVPGDGSVAHVPQNRSLVQSAQQPQSPYLIRLSGLEGGHSGEDIHRGRGNAISLLLRVLEEPSLRVVSIKGGTNRLAIPREAEAVVLARDEAALREHVDGMKSIFRKEYSIAAPELDLTVEALAAEGMSAAAEAAEHADPAEGATAVSALRPLSDSSFARLAALVRLYPNGITAMNGGFDGLVESSDNIGIIDASDDMLTLVSEVRGAYRSTVEDIKRTIDMLAAVMGAEVRYFNAYVPWEFEADSDLRELAVTTYREMYGTDMRQLAIHAGLECGFFAGKIPGVDIISIGPDCQYFHSPRERVSVSSTIRFYDYLKELLRRL